MEYSGDNHDKGYTNHGSHLEEGDTLSDNNNNRY